MFKFENQQSIIDIESEMPYQDRVPERTIYQRLLKTAEMYPDNKAVSYQLKSGPNDKAVTLTWQGLVAEVTKMANYFRSIGIEETDVVAFLLPSTHETLLTLLGGMTAGIVAPINPTLDASQIAALLRETKAKVVVTMKPFPKTEVAQLAHEAIADAPNVETVVEIDLLPLLTPPLSWIVPLIRPKCEIRHKAQIVDFKDALAGQNGDALDFEENLDDRYCAYFHTGGTTGMPKLAQHRHSGILYNGWIGAIFLYKPGDSVICPLPLFHVFAAHPIFAGIMASGAHMVLITPAGYRGEGVFKNFWKLVERWNATFFATVPTAVAMLNQQPVDANISSLENVFCGSAPLPVEIFKRLEKNTNVTILEGYGMTEATCLVSCNPSKGEKRIGSVGIRFPYTEIRILDCDKDGNINKECDVNEIGEICVYNPGVNIGEIYTEPDKNKGLFADNKYFRTGDLGRLDADGYLWITGRAKDLIIRGGHNIDPAVIEEALLNHPDIAFVGAIGQPDSHSGEVPCAYVELNVGASVEIEELMAIAEEKIGERAAIPKHIEILPELPKTAVGKTFKPDLRRLAIQRKFDEALQEAGVDAFIDSVIEDKKRGLVAQVKIKNKTVTEDEIQGALGSFIRPWELV